MRFARYFSVIGCVVLLAGCGGGDDLDAAEKEEEIAQGLAEDYATPDAEVDCPDGIERKKNDVFECSLSAPGGVKAMVTVTQVDEKGTIHWEVNP